MHAHIRSGSFSLVFINNLINDTLYHLLLFVLYCQGYITVIYNMYNSMTS